MFEKIKSLIFQNRKKIALLLGLVAATGFAPLYFVPLTLVSFALVLKLTDMSVNCRQALAIGYWFGFGLFAAGFYWVGNALLVDVDTFGWLYPLTLFAAGAFFGLYVVPSFFVWHQAQTLFKKIIGFAASWVLMEWFRAFFLTGFPWNLLGSVWVFDPIFIQTASIWGTYGLSFLTVLMATGLYLCFCRRFKSGLLLMLLIVSGMYFFGFWRLSHADVQNSDTTVRLVQPSIPQQMKWNWEAAEENLKQYIELSREKSSADVDFVVWGETAVPFDLDREPYYKEAVSFAAPENGYLITGLIRFDGQEAFNSLYVLDSKGKTHGFYDKNHLVPFGEYIPLREYFPAWIRPVANNISDLGVGEKYKNITLEGFPPFGALICYEIIFPDEVINRLKKPSWVVVLSNDGWYGNSSGPYQHLAAVQLRAVEEGITIVRSANTGISAVVDCYGKILGFISLGARGYLDVNLPAVLAVNTPYGNGIRVWLLVFLAFLLGSSLYNDRLLKSIFTKNS